MGFLEDLYISAKKGLDLNQVPFDVQRTLIRPKLLNDIDIIERSLLIELKQADDSFLRTKDNSDTTIPFDELEFIVKNNVPVKQFIKRVKQCVWDLDKISTSDDQAETELLHRDALSVKVLNLLHRQAAQVLLLSGADDNGRASWFVKQPKAFIQAVLLEGDKPANPFDNVDFENDLSSLEQEYQNYLRRGGSSKRQAEICREDQTLNDQVTECRKDVQKWDKKIASEKGERLQEYKYRKMLTEKKPANLISARKAALLDEFRRCDINEYYYSQRAEQLASEDFSKVPDAFEADALKNRAKYLKEHDLQDLSKEEADAVFVLAEEKAKKSKNVFL